MTGDVLGMEDGEVVAGSETLELAGMKNGQKNPQLSLENIHDSS